MPNSEFQMPNVSKFGVIRSRDALHRNDVVLWFLRMKIEGFPGVGKIWDDKYEKVWYNVIIQIWDKLAAVQRAYYFTWRYKQ